jgi:small subunit ribosomal protein S18
MQQRREMGGQGAGPAQSGPMQGAPSGAPQGGPGGRGRGRDFRSRRKVCAFCVDHVREIDYKDVARLRRYLSDRGKIEPRRKTGTCARHQRRLSVALKNARHMALMPYTSAHIRGI